MDRIGPEDRIRPEDLKRLEAYSKKNATSLPNQVYKLAGSKKYTVELQSPFSWLGGVLKAKDEEVPRDLKTRLVQQLTPGYEELDRSSPEYEMFAEGKKESGHVEARLGFSSHMMDYAAISGDVKNLKECIDAIRPGPSVLQPEKKVATEGEKLRFKASLTIALYTAVEAGESECVDMLLEEGADINGVVGNKSVSPEGDTPLHRAAFKRNPAMVTHLLSKETINMHPKNKEGLTPLHVAAKEGNTETIKALLKKDTIDLNAQDNKRRTPISYAMESENLDSVRVLRQHGAKSAWDML